MREGSVLERGGEMIDIGAEQEPLQTRQSRASQHGTKYLTRPARTGRAAATMATKTRVMMIVGLLGSSLKMWWISGSLP